MAQVRLVNVSKIYQRGRGAAVSDVSLDVADGEFLVLVGPSGCGKSTTLRMIAGLEEVSAGTISIGDRVVNDIPPGERDIAMVFQSYALYPHMTVRENLAFALTLRRLPHAEIDERVQRAARMLELGDLLGRRPRELSGGQRQRVALGRALVREPQVFLFDEPLSNLDAALRSQMRREIAALHRTLGATMIYVTHDQVEAMTLGDRIVVMQAGTVQQVDTPLRLYDMPVNRFVAGFIGSPAMNFLDGVVDATAGRLVLTGTAASLPATGAAAGLVPGHDRQGVTLGVRAEHVALAPLSLAARAEASAIAATVDMIELMGSEMFVHAHTGDEPMGETGRTPRIVCRAPAGTGVAPGDRIALDIDMARVHCFDAGTGERLVT